MANENNPESTDHVDDLFDYDVGLDGILQEINTNTSSANGPSQSALLKNSGVVLGLDEEVKVAQKRQPVAKLDENRLLTQAGIPKLRRSAKNNLKFKGKGHEFSDLARLLNFYQLWLDDLFPRAKFADGLAMIERLGHSKRLQTMRREWIDEKKLKSTEDEASDPLPTSIGNANVTSNGTLAADTHQSISNDIPRSPGRLDDMDEDLFIPDNNPHRSANEDHAPQDDHEFDDEFDELDALLREHKEPDVGKTITVTVGGGGARLEDDDFDELDALLREHEDDPGLGRARPNEAKTDTQETDSHADELEAFEALEGLKVFDKAPL
ncbi:replication fork protection component Swi3-domain-containing protein [Aspergillus spectabilis]